MGAFDFDVAVIGGGSAGYATARTTAAAGQRTVVIEAGEELGGGEREGVEEGREHGRAGMLLAGETRHRRQHATPGGSRADPGESVTWCRASAGT